MQSKTTILFVVLLALIVAVSGCTNASNSSGTPSGANPTVNTPSVNTPSVATIPSTVNQNQASAKITDVKYANKAYLISGDTLDSATQNAMSGFSMNKIVNTDGTTTISLSSSNPDYQNQSYTLQPGQKLYFIEKNLGDDGSGSEFNLGDDTALITDADGNII
jgi:hypothetical protein